MKSLLHQCNQVNHAHSHNPIVCNDFSTQMGCYAMRHFKVPLCERDWRLFCNSSEKKTYRLPCCPDLYVIKASFNRTHFAFPEEILASNLPPTPNTYLTWKSTSMGWYERTADYCIITWIGQSHSLQRCHKDYSHREDNAPIVLPLYTIFQVFHLKCYNKRSVLALCPKSSHSLEN